MHSMRATANSNSPARLPLFLARALAAAASSGAADEWNDARAHAEHFENRSAAKRHVFSLARCYPHRQCLRREQRRLPQDDCGTAHDEFRQ
jgi:hypothetical protein